MVRNLAPSFFFFLLRSLFNKFRLLHTLSKKLFGSRGANFSKASMSLLHKTKPECAQTKQNHHAVEQNLSIYVGVPDRILKMAH